MKMEEYKFIVDVPPDKDTIERAHKVLAQAIIDKFGIENTREMVKIMKAQSHKSSK